MQTVPVRIISLGAVASSLTSVRAIPAQMAAIVLWTFQLPAGSLASAETVSRERHVRAGYHRVPHPRVPTRPHARDLTTGRLHAHVQLASQGIAV